MYEVSEYIHNGDYSVFFRIKGHPNLGVKIRRQLFGNDAFKMLEDEYHKGLLLQKMGVSVPKFVGIIKVVIPKVIADHNKYYNVFSYRVRERMLLDANKQGLPSETYLATGLVMEFISDDIQSVDKKKIEELYSIECQKIRDMGIIIKDSDSNSNILWSIKKNKIYFVDFDFWDLSKYHVELKQQKERIKFPEKVLVNDSITSVPSKKSFWSNVWDAITKY